MNEGLTYLGHFTPVIMMIAVLAFNHGLGRWRAEARADRDADRLRVALRAELITLLDILEGNLRGIGDGATLLLSSRSAAAVYRGNIQRLVSLTEDEISPVVAAFAWNDAAEALLGAAGRGGPPAQKAECERAAVQAIKAHHAEGVRRIGAALVALEAAAKANAKGRAPAPAPEGTAQALSAGSGD